MSPEDYPGSLKVPVSALSRVALIGMAYHQYINSFLSQEYSYYVRRDVNEMFRHS